MGAGADEGGGDPSQQLFSCVYSRSRAVPLGGASPFWSSGCATPMPASVIMPIRGLSANGAGASSGSGSTEITASLPGSDRGGFT